MTYQKPLMQAMHTTPETAACRPCLTLSVQSPAPKNVEDVTVTTSSVAGNCPTAPNPGTPSVGGISVSDYATIGDGSITIHPTGADGGN